MLALLAVPRWMRIAGEDIAAMLRMLGAAGLYVSYIVLESAAAQNVQLCRAVLPCDVRIGVDGI